MARARSRPVFEKGSSMRAVLTITAVLLASPALAQDAGSTQVTQATAPPTAAGPSTSPTRSQLVAQYPQGIADRPRGIGAGLFEAGWDGSWQFNASQGFGEVPNVRYGILDSLEVTLLGVRYIVAEDSQNVPGLALRAQLHDLAFQNNQPTTNYYPILRPGGFVEFRDRFPFHLTLNGLVGYEFSVQTARATNGTELQESQRISSSFAPLELELQWSPVSIFSVDVVGGYIDDTTTSSFAGVTQSQGILSVALVLNTSRFDFKVFYTSNWFTNPALGYVPELGIGAAIRL
jgi:hypothetical protein